MCYICGQYIGTNEKAVKVDKFSASGGGSILYRHPVDVRSCKPQRWNPDSIPKRH